MNVHRSGTRALLLAAALLPLASCATTTFESTWTSPQARPLRLGGRKVVGLFVTQNAAFRRAAEDAMAREITARGADGIPAYTVLSDPEIHDQDLARKKLESLGFSGCVVMRVVGKETQYTYQPSALWGGPYYSSFWGGYWPYGWGTVYSPGYLTADTIVRVETLVYSFEQNQIVWAGVSRTISPKEVEGFIGELSKAVADQMVKDGLLAKT